MNIKRMISSVSLVAVLSTSLLGSSVFADDTGSAISEEKLKLMIAAGELIPGQTAAEENVKIKKDKAIEIARTMLEDASAFDAGNIYLNPAYSGVNSSWSINFVGKNAPGVNANVNVDADSGDITGYSMWQNNYGQQNYIARYTKAEAQVFAEDFLKNKVKYDMSGYELQTEDPYSGVYRMGGVKETFVYNYTYIKKINGVMLPSDTIYVGVDGSNGKVANFNHNAVVVDTSKLPSANNAMPADKALEKYKETLSFSLQYVTQNQESPYGQALPPKVLVAYVPTYYSDYLDAEKGFLVNYDGSQLIVGNLEQPDVKPVPMKPGAVLPAASPKTEAQARTAAEGYRKNIQELFGVKFDDATPGQPEYYGGQGDIWTYNWSKNSENTNYYFNISINRTTGRIANMGYGRYDSINDKTAASGQNPPAVKEKVTWSMGKEKALEMVKKMAPEMYGFYADRNFKEPALSEEARNTMREYSYTFTRVENGILFRDNSMSINIDRETGDVKGFNITWSDVKFPPVGEIVTQETAEANYLQGLEARLQYLPKISFDSKTQTSKTNPVPALVYSFVRKGSAYGGGMYINASTGKLMDFSGREILPPASDAQPQLGESWAKRSVELLIAQGIIKNPYVDYDTELTRAEAVKMLSTARGSQNYYDYAKVQAQTFSDVPKESPYFPYVENAVQQGIIAKGSEFKGEEKLTKEEFAVLLVNMTGYDELAKKSSAFKTDGLNVANPANAGYVAVCSALDFLPVKPGETFTGSVKVTVAEAAAALYKAMGYIR